MVTPGLVLPPPTTSRAYVPTAPRAAPAFAASTDAAVAAAEMDTLDPALTAVLLIVMGVAREDALAAVSVFPNLPARALVIVVAKLGSLPKAAASSCSVSNAAGEELTRAA